MDQATLCNQYVVVHAFYVQLYEGNSSINICNYYNYNKLVNAIENAKSTFRAAVSNYLKTIKLNTQILRQLLYLWISVIVFLLEIVGRLWQEILCSLGL